MLMSVCSSMAGPDFLFMGRAKFPNVVFLNLEEQDEIYLTFIEGEYTVEIFRV